MSAHNLALVFSSCFFQTKGQTSEEVNVIEDLINNYVEIFEVNILYPALVKIVLMLLFANKNIYFRMSLFMSLGIFKYEDRYMILHFSDITSILSYSHSCKFGCF